MSTVSIADVLKMPDKTNLDAIQAFVAEVYQQRDIAGGKTVQDAKLRDSAGNEVKLSVWDHNDISVYKGREVVIQSGPKGGLKVTLDTYKGRNTNYISASRMATFQPLEVHNGNKANPGPSVAGQPSSPSTHGGSPTMVVNGAKVGMACNNAVLFMTQKGEDFNPDRLWEIASGILNVSVRLENGDIAKAKEDLPY